MQPGKPWAKVQYQCWGYHHEEVRKVEMVKKKKAKSKAKKRAWLKANLDPNDLVEAAELVYSQIRKNKKRRRKNKQ